MHDLVISGGLAIWAVAIAWKDWRSHRVPNVALVLLLVPALLALVVNGKGLLGVAILPSLMGFFIGGGILLPGYAIGKMGAGDVKFAACMGLLLGPLATLKMLLVFAIILGALSAAVWLVHRHVPESGKRRIAAAPALAVGFIVQLFAESLLWSFF
ncbi:prepilin peptidase [Stenotrophobium rhamnosiphilum]|uniref:prepilin peptidase n=1 Tax=Stenotrophobium rhamnosiphilum TaxID=2029166 RepID=UPI0019D1DD58|nr:prepilin peptidase [Stenotrophobium rhamnosiphilum]